MAIGVDGSTFVDELNRLANGGTYPDVTAYLEEQGAANKYANTTGLGVLGALNLKASATRTPDQYKGLNAVCNELAGTTGLEAIPALRSINLP
jgi:hypothetical protein